MTVTNSGSTFGVQVEIEPQKLAEYLRGPDGPVFRMLIEDGERVKDEAKRLVGVYVPPPGGPDRSRRPGTLRDSIVKRMGTDNGLPVVQVGSDDPIALWHHEGTEPHTITPSSAPRLVFYWAKVGRVVAALRVNHPGTKPNRFLTDALAVLRGRH